MKKLRLFLQKTFQEMENTSLSFGLWLVTFFALIAVRLTLDLTVERIPHLTFFQFFFQWAHLFLFFLFSYLLLVPLVCFAGKTDFLKAARVLLFGFLLILFAPVLDKFIFGNSLYWSFYIFDSLPAMGERFLFFFGDSPHMGITYGTRINVALILFGVFLYGWAKTGLVLRSLFYTFATYAALFFLGTLPSWLAYLMLTPQVPLLAITDLRIAELFLSPQTILGREIADLRSALASKMSLVLILINFVLGLGIWYHLNKKEFLAFLGNARWPQLFCQNGIFFIGMILAIVATGKTLSFDLFSVFALITVLLSITAAWLASVLWNDIYDQKIDKKTNPARPLITGALTQERSHSYAFTLFFLSVFGAALISFSAALLMIAYQAVATLYSVPPFRLKRFLGLATLAASGAGLIVLLTGFVIAHPTHSLQGLPLSLVLYLGVAYTLMLPVKDFKDITGDAEDGIKTLPGVLGESRAKAVLGSTSFLVFMGSVFVLRAPELFLWALLFGSVSFWLIQRAGLPGSRISYHNLFGALVAVTIGYGLGLVIFLGQ